MVGSPGNGAVVRALAISPLGDVIAGGDFASAGGTPVGNVARWNGSAWSALGSGLGGANANVIYALLAIDATQVIAGGGFSAPSNKIARFDGTNWVAMGTGANNTVRALAPLPDGRFVASGFFTSVNDSVAASRIAIGSVSGSTITWSALGTGLTQFPVAIASAVAVLPSGDILAGGGFTAAGGNPASNIARWNAATGTWSAIDTGLNISVSAVAFLPNGDILAGGGFSTAGGETSAFIARAAAPTAPTITAQPQPATACVGQSVGFTVGITGTAPLAFQWRKETVAIDTALHPSAATSTLVLNPLQPLDAGTYDCIVSSACGAVTTAPATLTIDTCGCSLADIAGGGAAGQSPDGIVDGSDYIAFINSFSTSDVAIDPLADVVPDGIIDGNDFIAFINAFAAGC
jgi:hypothetical protein